MPGSVQYNIRRYQHNPQWATEDVGMLVYHYEKNDPADNYLELRFCVTGNMYCREKDTECSMCKSGFFINCADKVNSVDVFSFRFSPVHLSQFVKPRTGAAALTETILNFTSTNSFNKMLPSGLIRGLRRGWEKEVRGCWYWWSSLFWYSGCRRSFVLYIFRITGRLLSR